MWLIVIGMVVVIVVLGPLAIAKLRMKYDPLGLGIRIYQARLRHPHNITNVPTRFLLGRVSQLQRLHEMSWRTRGKAGVYAEMLMADADSIARVYDGTAKNNLAAQEMIEAGFDLSTKTWREE